ncbi:MAG: four helix bundle protein [Acidobacteria bacterium]|nr:four helix bundle protein [Acidobacteriota bacterium]
MKYRRFEDLPVWQAAIEFAVRVFALTVKPGFKGHGDLRGQLESAAVSISNNIAEGFERGTTQELLTFLYISRGSAAESRSMLCFIERVPVFADLKSEISDLKSQAESVSRQLRAWADSLQNSDIKGTRYLTDKVRQSTQAAKERQEFLEELKRVTEENIARARGKSAG